MSEPTEKESVAGVIVTLTMCAAILLKLLGVISASWWLILIPMWLPIAVGLCMLALGLLALIVGGIAVMVISFFENR